MACTSFRLRSNGCDSGVSVLFAWRSLCGEDERLQRHGPSTWGAETDSKLILTLLEIWNVCSRIRHQLQQGKSSQPSFLDIRLQLFSEPCQIMPSIPAMILQTPYPEDWRLNFCIPIRWRPTGDRYFQPWNSRWMLLAASPVWAEGVAWSACAALSVFSCSSSALRPVLVFIESSMDTTCPARFEIR